MSEETNAKPDTAMCVLSYLGLLALIPFFVKKDDAFIQWHAKQGLLILLVMIAINIALGIVISIVPALSLLSIVVFLSWLVLTIVCIMNALKGGAFKIPVLSGFIGDPPAAA